MDVGAAPIASPSDHSPLLTQAIMSYTEIAVWTFIIIASFTGLFSLNTWRKKRRNRR